MKLSVSDGLGWAGALLVLSAYVLVSYQFVTGDSLLFQFMNLFGSFGLIISSLSKKDYQPVALNAVFAIIAVITIIILTLR